jgi:lysophospholipase L1-like esterase
MPRIAAGLAWMMVCLLGAAMSDNARAADGVKTLVEWHLGQAADLAAWSANADMTEVQAAGEAMSCRTTGGDPILELRRPFEIQAASRQALEVELKADGAGEAEFFWSGTTEGKYGGFTEEKRTPFSVVGDGQWHLYRVFPFWESEKKILRLRLDLFGGSHFSVKSIRINQWPDAAPSVDARFEWPASGPLWSAVGTCNTVSKTDGLEISGGAGEDFLLGPPVRVDAGENTFVSIRMTATRGREGELFFATDRKAGRYSLRFPIIADGKEHLDNIDLLAATEWRGHIISLGFRPSEDPQNVTRLRSLGVFSAPQGDAKLAILAQGLDTASPRAGISTPFTARIANRGGGSTHGLKARLEVPAGVEIESAPADATLPSSLVFPDEVELRWMLKASAPVTGNARLCLTADNADAVTEDAPVEFSALQKFPKADYVPEPQAVRGKFDVGVYYFPGWRNQSQWQPIQRFPERRPMLGWYREGDPEVADWQIKWAVEHGITFFAYDWYWSRGARSLEHGIHDAYFHSRYKDKIKFCLLWANHNAPGTHSIEDSQAVAGYWITNYFQRPEYYRIDGKPVVIIFSPYNYKNDLGVDGVNRAFETMREACRKAGLPGLYIIACVGATHQVDGENYDAVTAYNWPGLGISGAEKRAPYSSLIPAYAEQWNRLLQEETHSLLLPLCGGWDSRPWHGDAALARTGRTPALFKQHLADARRFLETNSVNKKVIPAVLVEAWNEWGEGSYIEPHREFGFGYLDAIREVFVDNAGPHTDPAPVDVGRGPYDVTVAMPEKSRWTFAQASDEWQNTMEMDKVAIADGALTGLTTGNDPAFFGPPTQARAMDFPRAHVKMRLTRVSGAGNSDMGQFFWATRRWPESESSSVAFPVSIDGQWHDYELVLNTNRRWAGIITRLRLDPVTQTGIRIEIQSIELCPRAAAATLEIKGPRQLRVCIPSGTTNIESLLTVTPPEIRHVSHEKYEALPVYNSNSWSGWNRGVPLRGVFAQECSTPGLLVASSVVLRSGTNDSDLTYEPGKDYSVDSSWGTLGRLPQGRIAEKQTVYATYDHAVGRLDSIVLTENGTIEIHPGDARAAAPEPPALIPGQTLLANLWFPGVVEKLTDENLFPVLETAYPEPQKPARTIAEERIPRTLTKLRNGEPVRILAWGDSVTDGSYVPGGLSGRWQEQFAARLRERFPNAKIELITEAWGGRNTDAYMGEPPGSPHNYKEKVLNAKPDLIVSEFVNDAGFNPEQVEQRYAKILADFNAIGAEWIILTPHYVRPDWMGLSTMKNCDSDPRPYVKGLREFATRHSVALADASLRFGRLWRQGIPYNTLMLNSINHPNKRGMKLFADALMEIFP